MSIKDAKSDSVKRKIAVRLGVGLEAVFRGPQAQAGAIDEIYFFASDCVPAVLEP
jgi:hypothetical protein